MDQTEELPKVCPSCGSHEYSVRNRAEYIVQQVWGEGGDNRKHIAMWPCMNKWHEEGMQREWDKLPEEEKQRLEQEIDRMFGNLFKKK